VIHIPERYSYVECYITLRCNMNCHYCINAHGSVLRKRRELSAKEWCLGLNRLNLNGRPLTIGGGEPTIHREFYKLVDGLNDNVRIDLLTNLIKLDLDEFTENIPASRFSHKSPEYKSIRASFHPASMDMHSLAEKAKILNERGYPVGIFGLNHPENLAANVEMTEVCSKAGVYFFVRDFLGFYDDMLYGYYKYRSALNGNRKDCECRSEEMLIGPDGLVYRCHRDLYEDEGSIGDILNIAFDIEDKFRPCANYGLCNPCDIKLKLKPDLTTANKCSVEIKGV